MTSASYAVRRVRRLRFVSRSAYSANKCRSAISAHWFHLAASCPHVALLLVDLAILAIAWQSAAKFRNVSGVVIVHAPQCWSATEKRPKGSRCAELLYGLCDCNAGTPRRPPRQSVRNDQNKFGGWVCPFRMMEPSRQPCVIH